MLIDTRYRSGSRAAARLGAKKIERKLYSYPTGIFTICGSAAYNLLIISAICVVSVPSPNKKRIKEWGVFVWTSVWSVFAYVWILVVLEFNSPKVTFLPRRGEKGKE